MNLTADSKDYSPFGVRRAIIIGLLILGLLSLRLIHLGADTPVLVTLPDDVGLFVDEGYKTMGPRNMVLFGSDSWHPNDDYPSWVPRSPLTQWSYYAAFRASSPTLESARVVTVLYFGLFLIGYVWAMRTRLPWPVFIGGLLAFGLESTLFFYSRTALFEIPLITFLYGLLFYFAHMDTRRVVLPLVLTAVCGGLVAIAIKMSTVLYVIPIGLAALVHLLIQTGSGPHKIAIRAGVFALTIAVLILFVTTYDWIDEAFIQINVEQSSHAYSISGAIYRSITMPLMRTSPFVIILGLICLAHGLATQSDRYLGSVYRLSLIFIVLLAPVIISIFPYNPLRYYLPVLPAYLLLVLEWFHLEGWRSNIPNSTSQLLRTCIVALLALAIFCGLYPLYMLLSDILPDAFDDRAKAVKYILLIAACAVGIFAWMLRKTLFQRNVMKLGGISILFVAALYSAYGITTFLISPTYQLQSARTKVAQIIGDEATLAGDWAPIFALNTPIRALYMNRRFNPVENIDALRPDYFIAGRSPEDERSLTELLQTPGVRVAEPIDVGTYYNARRRVLLYPLHYDTTVSTDDNADHIDK